MGNKPTQVYFTNVPNDFKERIINEYITKYEIKIRTTFRFETDLWHKYKDETTGRQKCIAMTEIMSNVLLKLKSPNCFYPEMFYNQERIMFHLIISVRSLIDGPTVQSIKLSGDGIPTHIANQTMRAAIEKEEQCSIMFAPLSEETVVLTSCGHLFSKEGLTTWFQTRSLLEHNCPTCSKHVLKVHSL